MIDAVIAQKRDVARAFLKKGSTYVYLRPRAQGTRIPSWLRLQDEIFFVIGYDLPIPIPDLEVTDTGISGTLSFKGTAHHCCIPWGAIFALTDADRRGIRWNETPTNVFILPTTPIRRKPVARAPKPKTKRPIPSYLRVIQ